MSTTNVRVFGRLGKIADEADGSIKVYGVASTGCRDSAGEIVTPDAMRAALPAFKAFPAVREMHQPKAAGTALEIEVDDKGVTYIVAHVVDAEAVKKVKAGVYRGFSIGGRTTKRDPDDRTVITGLELGRR